MSTRPALTTDEVAIPSVHRIQRSAVSAAILLSAGVLFIAGLTNSGLSAAVGLSLEQGVIGVVVFLSVSYLASLAFHLYGADSRAYRFCDYLEGFALSWAIAYFIEASSNVHSLFWMFHGAQVLMTALAGFSVIYLITVSAGPAYLAAVFFAKGDTASGWLSALVGISGVAVWVNLAVLSSERTAALRREAELRLALARISVARERTRISRDLHDNVATELTALLWRIHELSDALPEGRYAPEIAGISERLRSAISDLRNVVLALRGPELGFYEVVRIIEQRCRELCGQIELCLHIEGHVEGEEVAVLHDQVLPICFELVSNAARHSGARQIDVQLRVGERLSLGIRDDGSGLTAKVFREGTGGLHGVRERVAELNGSITLEPSAAGARITVELPRPLQQHPYQVGSTDAALQAG